MGSFAVLAMMTENNKITEVRDIVVLAIALLLSKLFLLLFILQEMGIALLRSSLSLLLFYSTGNGGKSQRCVLLLVFSIYCSSSF